MMTAPRTPGPASENLQGRKPRDVGHCGASDAMEISALAVCCRRALTAFLGSDELGRSIAMGRTDVVRRRLLDEAVVQGGAMASMVIAGREPAKCSTGMSPRTWSDHDVSILITAVGAAGR